MSRKLIANGHMEMDSPIAYGEAVDISGGNHTFTHTTRAIWVGTAGNLKVTLDGADDSLTLKNVPSGTLLPLVANAVVQTGTTASDIVGLW